MFVSFVNVLSFKGQLLYGITYKQLEAMIYV